MRLGMAVSLIVLLALLGCTSMDYEKEASEIESQYSILIDKMNKCNLDMQSTYTQFDSPEEMQASLNKLSYGINCLTSLEDEVDSLIARLDTYESLKEKDGLLSAEEKSNIEALKKDLKGTSELISHMKLFNSQCVSSFKAAAQLASELNSMISKWDSAQVSCDSIDSFSTDISSAENLISKISSYFNICKNAISGLEEFTDLYYQLDSESFLISSYKSKLSSLKQKFNSLSQDCAEISSFSSEVNCEWPRQFNYITGTCELAEGSCISSLDCSIYEDCINNECILRSGYCYDNYDCPSGEICSIYSPLREGEPGSCIEPPSDEVSCKWYENNVDGVCVIAEGFCETDYDCGYGEVCVDNICEDSTSSTSDASTSQQQKEGPPPVEELQKSIVTIYTNTALGSGVFMYRATDNYIYILTNRHVVEDDYGYLDEPITIKTYDGKVLSPNDVLVAGHEIDLALLKVFDPYNEFGETYSSKNQWTSSDCYGLKRSIGRDVWAIGAPRGLEQTVTKGIISAFRFQTTDDGYNYYVIQTDAAINPGNSGGGLFDKETGCLLGINTAIFTSGGGSEGLGFAIDLSTYENLLQETWYSLPEYG